MDGAKGGRYARGNMQISKGDPMRIALSAVLLCGCTTVVTPVYVQDGQKAYLVECRGMMSRCHQAAAETCKGAYVPMEKSAGTVPFLVGSSNQSGGSVVGGGARHFELTFRCQ
jgi:hypothetical protein